MKETTSYDIFFRENVDDLKKMLVWKTGIKDHDFIEDFISKLLLHMIEKDVLLKFDRKLGTFKTYIATCMFRFMQHERKGEVSEKSGFHITKVEYDEILHGEEGLITEISDIEIDWKDFYEKIQSSDSISDRRKKILELAASGMNGVEIADTLYMTPQAVSLHIIFLRDLWEKHYNKE
jgi:hypothetical protein